MTRHFLTALLAPLLLTACGVTAPPRDNAQFTTTLHGVNVTWRYVNPGALNTPGFIGYGRATFSPAGQSCVVDLDAAAAGHRLVKTAAHELGHCFAARWNIPGIARPDLGEHYATPEEGYAETYAQEYLTLCGPSLAPLGWNVPPTAFCTELPDPWDVYRRHAL